MGELPLKFILKIAKIPLYVGLVFFLINTTLVFFTALRVNTIAHTAMLVVNENNFMPAHERRIITSELALMGRPGVTDRQGIARFPGIQEGTDAGSPIVGGWNETYISLRDSAGERVQQGTVTEFELFVWFRPFIPVFGNLIERPADTRVLGANDGFTNFNRHMLDEIGVIGGQTGGGDFTITDNSVGMFGGRYGGRYDASLSTWDWSNPPPATNPGLQGHLDGTRSWFDFRIGGCFRAVGLQYYPDLEFGGDSRGGCPSFN